MESSRTRQRAWVAICACAAAAPIARALPPGFVDQAFVDGWNQASGVAFAPDGRAFVWEKAGRVWLVENGVKSAQPLLDIHSEVRNFGDYGLLGLALDPAFMSNGRLYLLYAVDYYYLTRFGTVGYDPQQNNAARDSIGRLTRYTCNSGDGFHSVDPASRTVLVGESISTGFPLIYQSHGAGTLVFGEDGSLFAGSGDGASFIEMDNGGPRFGSTNTALADGIIQPKEDVGAFRAQLVDSLAGKIIRISPETGDGLAGNPFFDAGSPRSPRSRVWAMGMRNPFRFSLRPGSASSSNPAGVLYVGDVGWDAREEIDVVRTGGQNFGWPLFEGLTSQPQYTAASALNRDAPNPLGCATYFQFRDLIVQESLGAPTWPNPCDASQQIPASVHRFVHSRGVIEWGHGGLTNVPVFAGIQAAVIDIGDPGSPISGDTISGSCALGGVWYSGVGFGPEFQNTYFMADFVSGTMKNMIIDTADDELKEVRPFHETGGPIVCMAVGSTDGALYYISYSYNGASTLRRIVRSGNLPPVVVANAGQTYGPAPLAVEFSTLGTSDPEEQPLTYLWDFGDGSMTSAEANPTHVFGAPDPGPIAYTTVLTVSDGVNAVEREFLISPNNSPPRAVITSPPDGTVLVLHGSMPVSLRASIEDPESSPGSLSCTWQRILHHNTHTHPDPFVSECEPASEISAHGATGDAFYYEFGLKVTDPQGLATSVRSLVFPVACVGDLTYDAMVDDSDFIVFVAAYDLLLCGDAATGLGCLADLNRDGFVDDRDFVVFVGAYDALICP